MTELYGIFGWPVAHSRSPAMHNAAFAHLGRDAVYVPFAVAPERLEQALGGVVALGVSGLNVTLPHKARVIPLLWHVEPDAVAIGAVNTILRDGDRLIGANTDAAGLARSLSVVGVPLAGARVVVLGAGGAARAAVVGLARAGAERVVVAARKPERAEALVASLSAAVPEALLAHADLGEELSRWLPDSTLLVQSTSATLESSPDAEAFAAALPLDRLPETAVVCDLVYQPRVTAVLARASARGLSTVDGLGMLLYQGALAFERWTGEAAPVGVMRAALES